MIFTTEYLGERAEFFRGALIKADSWEHAQVRLEFAIAMGWVPETTELVGELVEEGEIDEYEQ